MLPDTSSPDRPAPDDADLDDADLDDADLDDADLDDADLDDADLRVWVVEDAPDFRAALTQLLEATEGIDCGEVFGSVEDALAHLDALASLDGDAASAPPDVLLLDVNLPGQSGLEGLGRLKARLPDTRIVMLTIRDEAETIYEALRAGASGYLLKNAGVDQILAGVREAHRGGTLMSAPVARKVLAFFQAEPPPPDYGLTEREREVLREMAEGYTQKEIAARLFVSPHTVNSHVQHLYEKLHVRSGVEAVAKAYRERLV